MLADETPTPETPPESDEKAAEERALSRLAKSTADDGAGNLPSEAKSPAPILTDPIHRDKEATGEMRAVRVVPPLNVTADSAPVPPPIPSTVIEDDPPVITRPPTTPTIAPDFHADHGTMTPLNPPSASETLAKAQKKTADIVEDRVNMSGSVRQAKNARYEAIQETKATTEAFEKAADEVGSVVDQLAGKMGVMDFLIDKELDTSMEEALRDTPETVKPDATSADQSPEWKRRAAEMYDQKQQQAQALIDRRRADADALIQKKTAYEDSLRAGRETLEARLREERAASEARIKAERDAADAQRRAEQDRLRAERAAMDARLKEEREAKDAERRASKKLGRPDD